MVQEKDTTHIVKLDISRNNEDPAHCYSAGCHSALKAKGSSLQTSASPHLSESRQLLKEEIQIPSMKIISTKSDILSPQPTRSGTSSRPKTSTRGASLRLLGVRRCDLSWLELSSNKWKSGCQDQAQQLMIMSPLKHWSLMNPVPNKE